MTHSEATPFIEEGTASMQLARRRPHPVYDVIVIGGGQAGLSVGYHLARTGARFLILEAHARIGDAWRKRWDSLRLFTPVLYNSLPGRAFPGDPDTYPGRDDVVAQVCLVDEPERAAPARDPVLHVGVACGRARPGAEHEQRRCGGIRFESDPGHHGSSTVS